jgi:primosomal protein N' (replication factor Y)
MNILDNNATLIQKTASVRVDFGVNKEFTYLIPDSLQSQVIEGSRVRVPFGRRKILGTVLQTQSRSSAPENHELRSIVEVIGTPALLSPQLLELARWISQYYLCPFDLTLKALAPSSVRSRSSIRNRKTQPDEELDASSASFIPSQPLQLTEQQAAALQQIIGLSQDPQPKPLLLFGVTGSGKTEVYLQAIDSLLKVGKGALFLVPEISLTPQTIDRLRARFCHPDSKTDILAILHSGLSDGDRFREWHRIRSGEARLVVGARSAIFAPVQNLGIIVVDEEHESTYKQEESPRYHARDVAVMRGHFEKALVVLGSATPSLESFHNAQRGKYVLAEMPKRVDHSQLPQIRIIDMRQESLRQKGFAVLSETLKQAVQDRLDRGEQIILFLNRRGFATAMICPKCGYVAMCPHCSVTLSYSRRDQQIRCHFCNHHDPAPKQCPQCRDPAIRYQGLGTEKLEDIISKLFPQARVARMDSDTMTHRRDYERTLLRFRMGKLDLLLGTQMISKGLDFPRVTLVGMVYADVGLHAPDFRSSERTLQQLIQVAGRCGRGEIPGEVMVQTFTPEHESIQHGKNHDFVGYYDRECALRNSLQYPPFNPLIKIECSSVQESKASFACAQIQKRLKKQWGESFRILGPAPSPISKLRGKFRYQLLIGNGRMKGLKEFLQKTLEEFPRKGDVRIIADVDPMQLM